MTSKRKWIVALAALALLAPVGAHAGYKLVPAKATFTVATPASPASLAVVPSQDWNQLSTRPGKAAQAWTIDGMSLNEVAFFVGIADDQALLKEINKTDKPLPRFSSTMLAPDVAQLFEQTYRLVTDTSLFAIDSIEPAPFAGHDGFRFTYHYAVKDEEVKRKGEAAGAIVDGKLYLITYAAPALHYYDRDLAAYRAIVESATIGAAVRRR